MPSKAVADAFEARLATWAHIADCPFVDLNEVSDLSKPPFIEIEYPVSESEFASAGVRFVNRETGGARFVITVLALQPGWKTQVLAWVDELCDLFRAQVFDGVETFEASPAVLDDRNRDGNRYRVPFVVLYKRDSIKG